MKVTRKLAVSTLAVTAFALVAPVAASAATDTTTISSVVGATLTMANSNNVSLNANPTSGTVQTTAKDTVTVSTNNSGGYNLSIKDSDSDTDLQDGSNAIAATSGTAAAPTALTAGTWGYRVDGRAGFGAGPTSTLSSGALGSVTYAGVTASDVQVKSTSATASNDATDFWYSVAVNTSQPTGTYTDEVTYTAVVN